MIRFENVTLTYPGQPEPVLADLDLHVAEGELCLVVGATGTGKSTLLGLVNGLVPHFSGGALAGRVTVAGRDTRSHHPRDLADVVGMVAQDPRASFVSDTVEGELAYTMECLGLPAQQMRQRVEEVLDLLGLAELRGRPLESLSGGQAQRVAIGAVLAANPRVLVLDEPTSALDPPAAEDVLATLHRLVHDLGITVLVAEHRLERVVQHADRMVLLGGVGQPLHVGAPADVLAHTDLVPPVVALGRLARWQPLPLTVREARRLAEPLRERLAAEPAVAQLSVAAALGAPESIGVVVAEAMSLRVRRGGRDVLRGVDVQVRAGEVVALMGRNGAGKSTLLATLAGQLRPSAGQVLVGTNQPKSLATAPSGLSPHDLIRTVGLVPQEAGDLLFATTVAEECALVDRDARLPLGTTRAALDGLAPGVPAEVHPRDLSEGQRLALALAVVLAPAPSLVLLDEPTRGLDYGAKHRLVGILRGLAAAGHGVLLATHDVELAAEVADRTAVMADGELVAVGATADVVVGSPAFAPQVAKILAPQRWLTVGAVAAALAGAVS